MLLKNFLFVFLLTVVSINQLDAKKITDNPIGNESAFWTFLFAGNTQEAIKLLDKGINPNTIAPTPNDNIPAIIYATTHGYSDVVDKLIEKGADLNITGGQSNAPALYYAITQFGTGYGYLDGTKSPIYDPEKIKIALKLIGIGAEVKDVYLHLAAQGGYFEIVDALIKKKAVIDIFSRDNYGLKASAYARDERTLKLLGKDNITYMQDEIIKNRQKLDDKFDYSRLWPRNSKVLFIGEYHYDKFTKSTVINLIEKLIKQGITITYFGTEFLCQDDQSKIDKWQKGEAIIINEACGAPAKWEEYLPINEKIK
ncbi:MAG: ankyrin repeat domain-containing protein, partial [Proteobacteria bacterium]|nr:ankyrin repeat domain-containing protein [Pseudomonadota bacterium]